MPKARTKRSRSRNRVLSPNAPNASSATPQNDVGPAAAPVPATPQNPVVPPPAPSSSLGPVPTWVRTDWSETSFPLPIFSGSALMGSQFEWAAKNATVAIHDAFQEGSWDDIKNKQLAVYLAVCDIVLQLKDRAPQWGTGYEPLPLYRDWIDARERDIEMVFGWARRDLERYSGPLSFSEARHLCRTALQAVFWENIDATPAPTDELDYTVDLDSLEEFEARPSNLERYDLVVHSMSVGDEANEADVCKDLQECLCKYGSYEAADGGGKHLRGLPTRPKGYKPPPPTSKLPPSVVPLSAYPERPQDFKDKDLPPMASLYKP